MTLDEARARSRREMNEGHRSSDLLTDKREMARREAILDELVADGQELGMGY